MHPNRYEQDGNCMAPKDKPPEGVSTIPAFQILECPSCNYQKFEGYCRTCFGVRYIKVTVPSTEEIVAFNQQKAAENAATPLRGMQP